MSEIEYYNLLYEVSTKLDENALPRLKFMCTGKIDREEDIQNVLMLFKTLQRHHHLGIDRLDTLKEILTVMRKRSLVKKVEDFERRRKAQSVGIVSSVKWAASQLKGGKIARTDKSLFLTQKLRKYEAVKLVCNFRTIAGGLLVVSSGMALHSCSSLDEFVETFNKVVLVSYTQLVEISEGSLCFTVQAETPAALKELWEIYKDGTLQSRLHKFLVTDDIKQITNEDDIEMTVFIDELEYVTSFNFLHNQVLDTKEECFRRNSDSFLDINSNQKELTLMKLNQAENKLSFERQVHGEQMKKLKEKFFLEREPRETTSEILGRPLERRRRNSDSDLYYEARKEVEQTENQPEGAFEVGPQMDFDKRTFIENYLQNIHETHSMTTETSDSGIRTLGATSGIEMQDMPGGDRKLHWRDLREDVTYELKVRIGSDEAAMEQILRSFGIDRRKISYQLLESGDIFRMFPDTPVKELREVFEALRLYDLIDLLEEAKPRTTRSLRPVLPLQEIEKLRNPVDRPISYHSSVAVLIIDCQETGNTVGIEKFFKGLNTKSEVTVIRCKNYISKAKRDHQMVPPEIYWKLVHFDNLNEWEKKRMELSWTVNSAVKELIRTISEVIQRWISSQDKFSLFAVFFIDDNDIPWLKPARSIYEDVMVKLVTAFPTKVKLIIHPSLSLEAKLHEELFEVFVSFDTDDFLTLMLKIFTKRWQTMDLLSMMREVKRTGAQKYQKKNKYLPPGFARHTPVIVDNLSCLIRFIIREEPTNYLA